MRLGLKDRRSAAGAVVIAAAWLVACAFACTCAFAAGEPVVAHVIERVEAVMRNYEHLHPQVETYGTLQEATYSNSGNMLGNRYEVAAMRADDGSLVVQVRDQPTHSDPMDVKEYRAPDDLLERIDAIVDRVGMKGWSDLPPSELIALDASTPMLRLTYESANAEDRWPLWLTVSTSDELPDGGFDAMLEIRSLMLDCATDDALIRAFTE